MINTRILVAAGACLAVLVGSFALSRPDSQADGARPSLPPARVVGTVEPAPLPELGEASKLPALGREPKPKPKRRPAPVVVAPEPELEEPVETEPEYVEPVEPEYVPPPAAGCADARGSSSRARPRAPAACLLRRLRLSRWPWRTQTRARPATGWRKRPPPVLGSITRTCSGPDWRATGMAACR